MQMSSIYAPFRSDVEEQHRYTIRHKYSAFAYPRYGDPFELDIEDLSFKFDPSRSPHITADITAKVIEDQEMLDSLDPRNGCRVHIYSGYVYDGFVDDVHLMADLHLRERTIERPRNSMQLTLGSDEELALDAKRLSWQAQAPLTGINEFVQFHANRAMTPTVATVVSDFPPLYGAAELAGMVQEVGQDSLSMILDAAERLDCLIYCEGDRTWRIKKRSEYSGVTALKLFTGPSGTILDASTTLTRGVGEGKGFHNGVTIKYAWRDSGGVDRIVYGNAVVNSGPYAASTVGYNVHEETREYAIANTTLANNAAAATLRVLVGRGHQMVLSAHAAYWLRPGHTVTVQLPAGDQQRFLVREVQFNPVVGTMDLSLVQPINVEISTTSG